jgi:hypothetical protein
MKNCPARVGGRISTLVARTQLRSKVRPWGLREGAYTTSKFDIMPMSSCSSLWQWIR